MRTVRAGFTNELGIVGSFPAYLSPSGLDTDGVPVGITRFPTRMERSSWIAASPCSLPALLSQR